MSFGNLERRARSAGATRRGRAVAAQDRLMLLQGMVAPAAVPPERRVWCNRTLNLRAIKAVGFDMDYTLMHYRTEAWERAAFERALGPLRWKARIVRATTVHELSLSDDLKGLERVSVPI